MPLQPNWLERQLVKRGIVPWLVWDAGLPVMGASAIAGAAGVGLFEALAERPATRAELAERCECSRRGIDEVVHVLLQLGYLEEDEDRLALTKPARRTLPLGDTRRIAPFLQETMRRLADSERALREAPEDGIIGWEVVREGPVGEAYQALMRHLASGLVDDVVKRIDLHEEAERMLDVGGSHGLYTVAMCREHPRLRGTILDWPIGLEEARRTLDGVPELAERVDLVERDFEREELPSGYDFVFLGNIVHGLDADGNRALFDRIAQSTRPGAMFGILDQFAGVGGSKFARGSASLLGFNLFLFSGGRSYAIDRVEGWLGEAGFGNVESHAIRKSPGFTLLIAKKT